MLLDNNKAQRGDNPGAPDDGIGNGTEFRRGQESRASRRRTADTGSWLTGRAPRFSPSAFGMLDQDGSVSSSTFLPS
jgi:hypothetical protein